MRKEELRHDPVRENIVKCVEYIKDNKNNALKIFVGFVILVAVYSYYNQIGGLKNDNASKIAGLAQNSFINGEIDEAMVKFERVMDDYPSTSGATQSLIYLLNEALSQSNYESASILISQYKDQIDGIDDPIVQANIYKIQGDLALLNKSPDDALSNYNIAEKISRNSTVQVKYQLDVITALLTLEKYSAAQEILEDILDIGDVGYNEKNKAEEFLAYVKHKLDT